MWCRVAWLRAAEGRSFRSNGACSCHTKPIICLFLMCDKVVQGSLAESSGRAELQEHALAKLKARERGTSLGPMVMNIYY